MKRLLTRIVDFASTYPWWVLLVALVMLAGTGRYASRIELRTDILELLPRDSAAFKAYENQRSRVRGEANLIVVIESPNRSGNERYIDELAKRLRAIDREAKSCHASCKSDAACKAKCEPDSMGYIESDTKELRSFFENNKWLYAPLADLDALDQDLDDRIQRSSGLGPDDDEPVNVAPVDAGSTTPKFSEMRKSAEERIKRFDQFPSGYFATADGATMGLRIVSKTAGTGDPASDRLLDRVKQLAQSVKTDQAFAALRIGYAGDIPNIAAEKASIASEAVGALVLVVSVVFAALLLYFRSAWALLVILLPAFLSVSSAYAFAMWQFGYLNTAGAFLGAIILGNGINYPIVLLSRYREFRSRGVEPDDARTQAVLSAFRAELVGAVVAAIAYGSLTITEFRGFTQFGTIGFVGMLLVWLTMIPVVPALLVVSERVKSRLGMRERVPVLLVDGSRSRVTQFIAWCTHRLRWPILLAAVLATGWVAMKAPKFLKDPWEYDFDKLGSRQSKQVGGVGEWTTKADQVFGGKMNIAGALMLAESREQVGLVKEAIFVRDAKDPQGRLVAEVVTIDDYLPGDHEEQNHKLKVLTNIRKKMTERVLSELSSADRKDVEALRPPEALRVLNAGELPALIRLRFEEANGNLGAVFYVRYWDFGKNRNVSYSDGRTVLRLANTTDNIVLKDGRLVQTASRSTIFAEMIRSLGRDGPRATLFSFVGVLCVVLLATRSLRGALAIVFALVMGVVWLIGGASHFGIHLNFLNFVALPITFGIGSEYPFNIYDRARLLGGEVKGAVRRVAGAVLLCSFTTTVGYGSLLIADNQALQSFGLLALGGEIACVLCAVIVLPALLHIILPNASSDSDADLQPLK